jgi:hypothetical protein
VIAECRLRESDTHEKARINTRIESRVYPEIPRLEVSRRVVCEEEFLAFFFCISLDDEFSLVFISISTTSRFFYDIRDEFLLITRGESLEVHVSE